MSHLWMSTSQTLILCRLTKCEWVSVVTSVLNTKRLLWWGLRAALTYGCRDKNLEGSLRLPSLSRIIAVGSRLGPVNSSTMGYLPDIQYQTCFSSCAIDLKSNQKVVTLVTPVASMPLLHPQPYLATSVIHYSSSLDSQMGKAIDDSPTPSVYIASMEGVSQPGHTCFLHFLWPECVLSSSIGSYHWVLGSSQEWQL